MMRKMVLPRVAAIPPTSFGRKPGKGCSNLLFIIAIAELDCRLIYTTNFDSFIEQARASRPWTALQNNSKRERPCGFRATSAYISFKLHGGPYEPDHDGFHRIQLLRAAILRVTARSKAPTDAIGKSVLFIGYSLSDINVRYLLFRLQRQWEREFRPELRPKSYVFMGRPNPVLA